MRRTTALLLTAVFVLVLTGCGNNQAEQLSQGMLDSLRADGPVSFEVRAETQGCEFGHSPFLYNGQVQPMALVLDGRVMAENLFSENAQLYLKLQSCYEKPYSIDRTHIIGGIYSEASSGVHRENPFSHDVYLTNGRLYFRSQDKSTSYIMGPNGRVQSPQTVMTSQRSLEDIALFAALRELRLPANEVYDVSVRVPNEADSLAPERTIIRFKLRDDSATAGQIAAAMETLFGHSNKLGDISCKIELDGEGRLYALMLECSCLGGGNHTLTLHSFHYNDPYAKITLPNDLGSY